MLFEVIIYHSKRLTQTVLTNIHIGHFRPATQGATNMNLSPISFDITQFPAPLLPYLSGAALYDSSCSSTAEKKKSFRVSKPFRIIQIPISLL
jgi:hypothetical protein